MYIRHHTIVHRYVFVLRLYTFILILLLQGQYVLLRDPAINGFHMFDTSCGRIIWSRKETPGHEVHNDYEAFLTESFCGLLCAQDYYDPMDFPEFGYYHLRIYDNQSGQEIYKGHCGDFRYGEDRQYLQVAADSDYVLVCSSDLDGPEPGMMVKCVKVDSVTKTCLVRKTSVGLGQVLLNKFTMDEECGRTREPSSSSTAPMSYPMKRPEITYGRLSILGFAFESVVLCHAHINYDGAELAYIAVDTVFSIDLEKILDMFEPSSLFSAVNFPLGDNVLGELMEKHNCTDKKSKIVSSDSASPKYLPYYETPADHGGNGRVRLAGIVEIRHDMVEPLMPKVHTFKRAWVKSEWV